MLFKLDECFFGTMLSFFLLLVKVGVLFFRVFGLGYCHNNLRIESGANRELFRQLESYLAAFLHDRILPPPLPADKYQFEDLTASTIGATCP